MSELRETIERVICEVLASMGHTVVVAPAAAPSTAASSEAQPAAKPEDGESLVLDRRVVTLADLPDRIKAVQRVVVPQGAVVTPAVKDELQQRKIQLIVGEANVAPAEAAKAILMVAASTYDAAPLAGALKREGLAVEPRRMDCLIRATDRLADDLKSGWMAGILATGYTAAALCLANRHAGVRALLGVRADTVAAEAASVGANLLVVDPATSGFWGLKQMASRFLRGGPRQCPEVFEKRLG
jgi:hypothetical protein